MRPTLHTALGGWLILCAPSLLWMQGCAQQPTQEEVAELPAPAPRLYRLTHAQWESSVQDLFGFAEPTGLSRFFRDDPKSAGFLFDTDAQALGVDHALWTGYRLAAAEVARRVTEDPVLLQRWLPESGALDERVDAFVRDFGLRAHRRPLVDREAEELAILFSAAPDLYPDMGDPFEAGVRHVIEVVLQSPDFLYRIERSSEIVDDVVPLDDWEIAQRLSYFLWNTMPSDALFDAAADGRLSDPTQLEREALRMLEDPRAAAMVQNFHAQLMEVGGFANIDPTAADLADEAIALGDSAAQEHERFVRDVIFGGDKGLAELLTSTETFVNADLARLYGLEGEFDDTFVHTQLDPSRRGGILTQIGFLASSSTSMEPDAIRRGVFVARRLACLDIAAQPDGAPPLPAQDPDLTGRERIEAHTERPGTACNGCHGPLINPFGFAFEHYDAVGRYRAKDGVYPVDATTQVLLDGDFVAVDGALGLGRALAESPAVHACYVRHWIEYAAGRHLADEDAPLVERLGETSRTGGASLRGLIAAIVSSRGFSSRSVDEAP